MVDFVSETNFKRVCLYLESCANYLPCPDDVEVLKVTMKIYEKMGLVPETLKIALALNDNVWSSPPILTHKEMIKNIINTVTDKGLRRQLSLMFGEHGYFNLISFNEDDEPQFEEDDDVSLAEVQAFLE